MTFLGIPGQQSIIVGPFVSSRVAPHKAGPGTELKGLNKDSIQLKH